MQTRSGRMGPCCPARRLVAAGLMLLSAQSVVTADIVPFIGGTPDQTSAATFSGGAGGGAWQADVWSYAFIGAAGPDSIPATMDDPLEGQTLFVYVLRMSDTPALHPGGVVRLDVGNPVPAVVPAVGYDPFIVPELNGPFTGNRQNPSAVLSSLNARSVTYFFEGVGTLDAGTPQGEYSVLFFMGNDPPGLVNGTLHGQAATFDEHPVLGPIPEPGAAGLLAAGGLMLVGIRRRLR